MRTLIVGCGRVGSGLARRLDGHSHSVSVVDVDPGAFSRLGPGFRGTTFTGVGFDRDVLRAAGIETCDALGAVTGSDEANAVIARAADRFFGVPRVVARLYDPRQADLYRRLGVHTISPVTWGIDRLAELLEFTGMTSAATIGSGQVELVDVDLPTRLVGHGPSDLSVPGQVKVVAVTRNGRSYLADRVDRLEVGDVVHLAVAETAVDRVQDMLEAGEGTV
jgi:trk system potassium uptake protein TrkA